MLLGRWSSVVSIKAILAVDIPRGGSSFHYLRMFVLVCGGRKTGGPREKLSEQRQEPTTNSTHMSNITLPLIFLGHKMKLMIY